MRWSRRRFVCGGTALVGAGLLGGCGTVPFPWQSTRFRRVGHLSLRSNSATAGFDLFRDGLRDLGYVEGQTIAIDARWADSTEQLAALAVELVELPVDVIVAAGTTPVKAAMSATRTIPIVFPIIGDPVASGFVASLARPGGNVTGLSDLAVVVAPKRMQLLRELLPGVSRVMYLSDTAIDEANGNLGIREIQETAQSFGVTLVRPEFRKPADLSAAFEMAINAHVEAVMVSDSPLPSGERERIIALAMAARLPVMSKNPPFVVAGGLASYGVDTNALYRNAATYVDKILKGAQPAELPVEQPTKFEFVVNLRTARALGLTIPSSVLQQATEVIQ